MVLLCGVTSQLEEMTVVKSVCLNFYTQYFTFFFFGIHRLGGVGGWSDWSPQQRKKKKREGIFASVAKTTTQPGHK